MKRNLHILYDDKFTDGAVQQFERYYPGQNIYIILLFGSYELKLATPRTCIEVLHIRDRTIKQKLDQLIARHRVSNLFIHYLDPYKAATALRLIDKFPMKLYWIFYGADLYDYLQRKHNYQILDDDRWFKRTGIVSSLLRKMKYLTWFGVTPDRALQETYERVDYFCFWNEGDFQLFQKYFKSGTVFKPFIYYNALGNPDPTYRNNKKKDLLLINHSASPSGNHSFALHLLYDMRADLSKYEVLLPLSYGDTRYADYVAEEAKQLLEAKVIALREFLPIDIYQKQLSEVKIAIFAMRRQEAAGNIFQLLNMGAKVFLREANSMFHWLKYRGFIVFSLENDAQELRSLEGLTGEEAAHNRKQYERYFNAEVYEKMMQTLIDG